MQFFKKLIFLLTPQERRRAGLILIMIIIMAILDMIGVASILPFIAVLTRPELIESNFILNYMFKTSSIFGVKSNQDFLIALGILLFALLIISLSFKALTTYAQLRFVRMREFSIGKRLIETYLNQPYVWFLNHHSADLGKTILSEVQQLIDYGFNPLMELIAKGIAAIALIILLILVDPKLALIVGCSLSLAYGIVFYLIQNFLNQSGEKRLLNNKLRFTVVREAFGAAKEVKVRGLEANYINNFSSPAKIFAQTSASSQVIAQLPRFILEAIAFGGILLIILYVLAQTKSINNALPIVSLYVFAGYRLMPALQQIYVSFTLITFIGPSLNKLYLDLKNINPTIENQDNNIMSFNNNSSISLKNINFHYPDTSRAALKDINLVIPIKSSVGLIGSTGSGKTTLVDIILGLLDPQNGNLEVDGKIITKLNIRSWQRSIGYVPQNIYLIDDTIKSNIAFGVDPKKIDQDMVEKVSKIANLHEFIKNDLPEKYLTNIGEDGVKLSGGQRQRIGIARALYHAPKILILDEATSALDNQTEQLVMESLANIDKDITVIMIAHRLNTVKNCDIIFKFEDGRLVEHGTYNEIINKS